MIAAAMSGVSTPAPLLRLCPHTHNVIKDCSAAGKRGERPKRLILDKPLSARFCPIEVDPYWPDSSLPTTIDNMFNNSEAWFDPSTPADLNGSHVEVSGYYELFSESTDTAAQYLVETGQEGKGGGQVAPLFTAGRAASRESFYAAVRRCPTLSMVDFTAIDYLPLSFARVNLGTFSHDDLWVAYSFFLTQLSLRQHWKLYTLAKRDTETGGFSVIVDKLKFERLVNVARTKKAGPLRPSVSDDGDSDRLTPYFTLASADFMYWLGESFELKWLSSGRVAVEDSVPVDCDASDRLYPLARPLRSVSEAFSEVRCIVSETAVSLVGHHAISVEIFVVDGNGQILDRRVSDQCGVLGTGFPTLGAVADTKLVERQAKNKKKRREAFSEKQSLALKRRRRLSDHGDPDIVCRRADNVKAIETGIALPLGTPGEPGCFSPINFDITLPTKRRTKQHSKQTAHLAPCYDMVAHILGPLNDPSGNSGKRMKQELAKRNTARAQVKKTKSQIVAELYANVEYLRDKAVARKHGRATVERMRFEHLTLLKEYSSNNKMIHDARWRAIRALKDVNKLRDVNSDRDQSNSGPQSLRQEAATLDLSRFLLSEAASLGASRGPVCVVERNDDRRYGYTPAKVLRPFEFYPLISKPVSIQVIGCVAKDSADYPEDSVERRAIGYAAYLLETAVRASRLSELLSALSDTPGQSDPQEAAQIRAEVSSAVNMLRTALPARLFDLLKRKLCL